MAKSSEPHLPETIFIPDQTPHIEEAVARPHPLLETIKPLGRYSERAFLHFCPRRDNAIPFHPAFVDGKPLKIGFSAKLSARNPRNLSGRQFANVCNLYSRVSEIFRVASKWLKSDSLDANIGPLQNFCLADLAVTSAPSHNPKADSREGQNDSEIGDNPIRFAETFDYAGHKYKKEYVERGAMIALGVIGSIIFWIYYAATGNRRGYPTDRLHDEQNRNGQRDKKTRL
jgi:hypothetical protein